MSISAVSKTHRSTQEDDNKNTLDFIHLADQLTEFGKKAGVRIVGYRSRELPLFRALPTLNQRSVIFALQVHIDICNATLASGDELQNSKKIIWHGLKKLNYIPPSNLFELIDDEMIVEIHNSELQQVFRNFSFYNYCSYTLEELHCLPWTALYDRDEKCFQLILDTVNRLYRGEAEILNYTGPTHKITEKMGVFKYVIDYDLRYAVGLKSKKEPTTAVMLCEKATLLSTLSPEEEERALKNKRLEM